MAAAAAPRVVEAARPGVDRKRPKSMVLHHLFASYATPAIGEPYYVTGHIRGPRGKVRLSVRRLAGASGSGTGVLARDVVSRTKQSFKFLVSSSAAGRDRFKICARTRVDGRRTEDCGIARTEVVVSRTSDSVDVVDTDGYSFRITFETMLGDPKTSVADSAPGEAKLTWVTSGRMFVTNTTPGRNASIAGVNAVAGTMMWDLSSPLCTSVGPTGLPYVGQRVEVGNSGDPLPTNQPAPYCGVTHTFASVADTTLGPGESTYGDWGVDLHEVTVPEGIAGSLRSAMDAVPAGWLIGDVPGSSSFYRSAPCQTDAFALVWQSRALVGCPEGTPPHP